jgi:hypothetical protein
VTLLISSVTNRGTTVQSSGIYKNTTVQYCRSTADRSIKQTPEIDDQWAAAGVRLLQPGSAPRDCRFLVAPVPHWECSAHQIPPAARGRGEHARSEVDVTALPPQVAIGARGSTVSAPSAAYETVCVVAARSPRVFYCCYAQ